MFRTTRTLVALVRALSTRTTEALPALTVPILTVPTLTVATLAVATTVVGCADENQPEYHLNHLEHGNAVEKAKAIKRLGQFYEDAMSAASSESDATKKAEKQKAVDEIKTKIVGPLTKTYTDGYDQIDVRTRSDLIQILAGLRDPGTEAALKKALEEYAKKPTQKRDEADIKWVIRAQKDLKLPSLNGPLLEVFQKVEAGSPLGAYVYRDLNDTMLAVADKAWVDPLIAMLRKEIKQPENPKAAKEREKYQNELFWQTVAAQVLGELKDAKAVEPLIDVVLTPTKAAIAMTAVLAVVKIGKPGFEMSVKLLEGGFPEKALKYAEAMKEAQSLEKVPEDEPHLELATALVSAFQSKESAPPLIKAITATKHLDRQITMAKALAGLPHTEEAEKAFMDLYNGLPKDKTQERAILATSAASFMDPGMVPWMVEEAKKASDDLIKESMLASALKVAKADQIAAVKEGFAEYIAKKKKSADEESAKRHKDMKPEDIAKEKDEDKSMAELEYAAITGLITSTETVLNECKEDTKCYLEKAKSGALAKKKETAFQPEKAVFMIALLGKRDDAVVLIDSLNSIQEMAVRQAVALAISYLLPDGDKEVVTKLETMIREHEESADRDRYKQLDAPLLQALTGLRYRSGS